MMASKNDSINRIKRIKNSGKLKVDDDVKRKVYPEFADCEDCGGTLYKQDGTICECMAKRKSYNQLRHANIGAKYYDVNLEFYLNGLKGTEVIMRNGLKVMPDQRQYNIEDFVDFLKDYVSTFSARMRDGRGFIMCGDTGCGKTGAACYIVKRLLQKGFSGYYIDTNDLLETIDTSWSGEEDKKAQARDKLLKLRTVDVLVLDDFGSEYAKNKEWLYNQFLKIIKHRYSENRPTIMASNIDPVNLMSNFDEGSFARLSSVLTESFQVIHLRRAKDMRIESAKKKSLRKDMKK